MKSRLELRPKLDLLNETFKDLMMNQGNLQLKIKDLAEISIKISDMENRIKMLENDAKTLNPEALERRMKELNEVLNDKLSNLCNETEEKFINSCEYDNNEEYHLIVINVKEIAIVYVIVILDLQVDVRFLHLELLEKKNVKYAIVLKLAIDVIIIIGLKKEYVLKKIIHIK